MARDIEDNENAKLFWGHLSDANELSEEVKSNLRSRLNAAMLKPLIELSATDPLPTDLRQSDESLLTINGIGYDGDDGPFGVLVLRRAPDHNGLQAWTSDGNAVEHESNSSTAQSSLYFPASGLAPILYYRSDTGDWVVMVHDPAYSPAPIFALVYVAVASSFGTLGAFDPPNAFSVTDGYLPSIEVGQLARHGDSAPYRFYISRLAEFPYAWDEIVSGQDPRNTDAREWLASTVSQSEAESGLATTRRAWTAQRVRQAISAWWNSSGNVPLNKGGTGAATAREAVTNLVDIGNIAATSYTLTTADSGRVLRFTAATAVTVTVTGDLGVSWNALIIQAGAGQITMTASGGATINSFGALTKTAGQHASCSLLRVAASTYNLSGNLA